MFYCGPMKVEKLKKCNVSNAGIALIIDPDILDVLADLPPKKQWTEHLVEYPVIYVANVNRLLNSTVM